MEKSEKVALTFLGISALIVVLAFIVGEIGDFISANGYNVWDGLHIHKTLIGYLFILAGAYLRYEKEEIDGISLGLILMGVVIVLYDVFVWGVWLPITLV